MLWRTTNHEKVTALCSMAFNPGIPVQYTVRGPRAPLGLALGRIGRISYWKTKGKIPTWASRMRSATAPLVKVTKT
jgi:hypothetical protein